MTSVRFSNGHALLTLALLLAACATRAPAPTQVENAPAPLYLLLEPVASEREPTPTDELPTFRPLRQDHPHRAALERTLASPYLRWVLEVGKQARDRARLRCGADADCARRYHHPAYLVVVDGGNRPKQGLAIATGAEIVRHPGVWYVEIDPEQASTLIPHEYGHVMMFESLPGDLPGAPASLPHTTGAITNDVVAFSEGWGIHFETLAGDRREDEALHARLHRDGFATQGPIMGGDSLLAVKDLFSYAQSYRRYTCIKENCFAFLPRVAESFMADAPPAPADVLARWTDTTFDPARLRSLEQMVASEGVIATLFYRLATAPTPGGPSGDPGDPPLPDPERYAAFFDAFARISEARATATPAVLVFLQSLLESSTPAERARIARIALEVFHYTLTMPDAPDLYARLHEAGHRMAIEAFKRMLQEASPEMERSAARLAEHPELLEDAAAPELWLRNDALTLHMPLLGIEGQPLDFDLNTAPVELLRTIPGATYQEAVAIDRARRQRRGFRAVDDVAAVPGIRPQTADAIRGLRSSFLAAAGQ